LPQYNIIFKAGNNGRIVGGEFWQTIEKGNIAIAPAIEANTGWNFIGWDNDVTAPITTNITFTAQYTEIEYTVTFDVGSHGIRAGGGELT
jgi:hypothetical protein